jgi:hypothetical protein
MNKAPAATALIITLSTKMRLGPKSRAPDNRRAASAGMRISGPKPWDIAPTRVEEPEAAEWIRTCEATSA